MDESEVIRQFRQIIDEIKEKKITRQAAQARLHGLAGEVEKGQCK